jgi:transcriptional regulator with XRE-family HTH domain
MQNSIGEIIRNKRKELGLSQEALAELIGSDAHYISNLERGHRKPGRKVLVALSNALCIPMDTLMGVASNIVLHENVTELESKLRELDPDDRELVLDILDKFIDRLQTPKL